MSESAANMEAIFGSAWHVNGLAIYKALGHKTGIVTPLSAVTPDFIGQEYFDTVLTLFHRAVGLTSADWTVIGDPGISATELSLLDGAIAGTTVASKVVAVDANKHTDVLGLPASGLKIGTSGSETVVSATGAELNTVAGVTAGTVIASKAIVTDSGIKISGLLNCTYGAGTATVAPINLTAGTNLTTAAVGATEFDGKCFYDTAVASARQVRVDEQYCVLVADYAAVDQAAAQKLFNSSTNGALTLAAGTKYEFEMDIWLTNTGTTSHTWSMLFGGAATFTRIFYAAEAYTAASNALTALLSIFGAAATAVVVTGAQTSATENVRIKARGIMDINAGGTVIPQILASAQPGASGTPGVTIKAGSYFRCWPVGAAATAAVGNWS